MRYTFICLELLLKLAMVYCNSGVLIGLEAMVYELNIPWTTNMVGACIFLKCLWLIWGICLGVFSRTIISLILVGYKVVIANSAIGISLATYRVGHLIFRALAIRASDPQNALAQISFHSPRSIPHFIHVASAVVDIKPSWV